MAELTKTLAVIQTELKAKKSSYNSFGKYYFRKAEDILEGVKPFLLQHNIYVTVSEELIATDPVPMIKTTATISDGEYANILYSKFGKERVDKELDVFLSNRFIRKDELLVRESERIR